MAVTNPIPVSVILRIIKKLTRLEPSNDKTLEPQLELCQCGDAAVNCSRTARQRPFGVLTLSSVLSLKDSSRELLVEILGALNPYYSDVTEKWRERVAAEFGFGRRELGALERLSLQTAHSFFSHGDLPGFFENVDYFGMRLAKLQVDTRAVARSLEIY